MTPLGTILFSILGLLFVGFVGGMVWLAFRDERAIATRLADDGWTIERSPSATVRWRATQNGATIEVATSGRKNISVWSSVRLPRDTGTDDVIVTRKMPAALALDGALVALFAADLPPRWSEASPDLTSECDVFANDAAAGTRWLSPDNRAAFLAYQRTHRPLSIRFHAGAIEARWAEAPRDAQQLLDVVALLRALR